MDTITQELHQNSGFQHLELLAKQIVEGFISGIHKSPFHGFSSEFAEHKIYNPGESTKHIDWKRFAKTDKLYTKRYDEETNLRCHVIIDNSSSMHYPRLTTFNAQSLNKIGFSVLGAAAIMQLLKKQRDAVGLSVYSDAYDFYAPEKGSERHFQMLMHQLSGLVTVPTKNTGTDTYKHLHLIAEKIKRRSMVCLFTDMLQTNTENEKLFEALRHLKYNKHEVVLFHTFDKEKELQFNYDNTPKRFVDVETGQAINLYAENVKTSYQAAVKDYFYQLKLKCSQYRITYVEANINDSFHNILTKFLLERQKFM